MCANLLWKSFRYGNDIKAKYTNFPTKCLKKDFILILLWFRYVTIMKINSKLYLIMRIWTSLIVVVIHSKACLQNILDLSKDELLVSTPIMESFHRQVSRQKKAMHSVYLHCYMYLLTRTRLLFLLLYSNYRGLNYGTRFV